MSEMENDRAAARYGTGQQELYTVAEAVADSYTEHNAEFILYNGLYTATTGTDLRAEVAAARALPENPTRLASQKILKRALGKRAVDCLVLFNQLTTAIREGFDEEDYDDRLQEAGHDNYAEAQNEDWEAVQALMDDSTQFVTAYAAELTAGGLPATFAANLGAARTAFATAHGIYLQKREWNSGMTDQKLEANNAIYQKVINMCKDGQKIFRLQAAVRDEFTFEKVLALVQGSTTRHSVSGLVTRAADGSVVIAALLRLSRLQLDGSVSSTVEVKTDIDGRYKLNDVVNGRYKLTVTADGLVSESRELEVEDGPEVEDFSLMGA